MSDETTFPQPSRNNNGRPCGECHLRPGERCDICGAAPSITPRRPAEAEDDDRTSVMSDAAFRNLCHDLDRIKREFL